MFDSLQQLLIDSPVLLLFLVLAIGFIIGNLKFGSFQLGSVAGVLMAGLLFGYFGFEGNPAIQSLGFVLFIFSVGYQAGPKFIQAVRKDGRRYLSIAVIIAVTGVSLAYGLSKSLDFEPGISAGVLAGSLTSTPTLAAADDAVQSDDFVAPDGFTVDQVRSNITTAYAITYIFGLIGLIMVIRLLPGLLKINLEAEAEKLEKLDSAGKRAPIFSPSDIITRAFKIESEEVVGIPLEELYSQAALQFTIQKIKRDDEVFEPSLEDKLQLGDIVSLVGVMTEQSMDRIANKSIGPNARDRELLTYNPESVRICITKKGTNGMTLTELKVSSQYGCFVSRIVRLGIDIEVTPVTEIERGDVLHVTGPAASLEVLGNTLGHIEKKVEQTDLRTFSWSIVIGLILGSITISLGGINIGLGTAGGLLAIGLLVGYLRSLFPVFGRMPDGARWVFNELGLLVFMACVGLGGGAGFISTLMESGFALILSGIAVTLIPLFIAYFYGRKVLKMNPLMLLGAIVGAMTSGGALNVLNDQSKSTIASIGYTGAYAFANILLTIAGAFMIFF